MPDLNKIYLYRMMHIENVPHILTHGITHKTSPNSDPAFTPIGDPVLITTRNGFVLDNRKKLGEYIPFYFGTRMPMLYVVQNGLKGVPASSPEQIVYCVSSVAEILETDLDFVFTNGHAMASESLQFYKKDIEQIEEILGMNAIKSKCWKKGLDKALKIRKEAEFLVLGDIPVSAILGFVVYNVNAKTILTGFGISEKAVYINSESYF
ncbi:MAG: hypothetical protein B6D68_04075 [spirochete symbiont of Stewartia floridana]|nr:MAG: hypothetical protein B6D68_04075 [spirochete symbiont of Stewartia floridana]